MFRTNTSTPWIRGKSKRVLRRKARLYKRAKKTKNWTRCRKCQRDSKRELRKAYINNTINDGLKQNNSKPFWKYVKSKKEDNIGVSPLKSLKSGNHLVKDGKGKAEKLIDQFQSVFMKDDGDSIPPFPTRVNDSTSHPSRSTKRESPSCYKISRLVRQPVQMGCQTGSCRNAPQRYLLHLQPSSRSLLIPGSCLETREMRTSPQFSKKVINICRRTIVGYH